MPPLAHTKRPVRIRAFLDDDHPRRANHGDRLDQRRNGRPTAIPTVQPSAGRDRSRFRKSAVRIRAERVYSFHQGLLAIRRLLSKQGIPNGVQGRPVFIYLHAVREAAAWG